MKSAKSPLIVMAVVLTCGLMVATVRWYQNYERRLLEPGLKAYIANRYSEAIPYLERYLQLRHTDRYEPYYALATSYIESDKAFDKAERVLQSGLPYLSGKNKDSVLDLMASEYLERGQLARSVDAYRMMRTVSEAEREFAIGFAYMSKNQYREAIGHLSTAVALNPNVSTLDYVSRRPNAYILLARNYLELRDTEHAEALLANALAKGLITQGDIDETRVLPQSVKARVRDK